MAAALTFIQCLIPGLVIRNRQGAAKIYLYTPKFARGIRYFLQDYLASTDGLFGTPEERIPQFIGGLQEESSDFLYQEGVQIFFDRQDLDRWVADQNNLDRKGLLVHDQIDQDRTSPDPYIYLGDFDMSGDSIEELVVMVQNVEDGSLPAAVRVAAEWAERTRNPGYLTTAESITVTYVIYRSSFSGLIQRIPFDELADRSIDPSLYSTTNPDTVWIYQYLDNDSPPHYAALLPMTG